MYIELPQEIKVITVDTKERPEHTGCNKGFLAWKFLGSFGHLKCVDLSLSLILLTT
jgi:hypothetical protein